MNQLSVGSNSRSWQPGLAWQLVTLLLLQTFSTGLGLIRIAKCKITPLLIVASASSVTFGDTFGTVYACSLLTTGKHVAVRNGTWIHEPRPNNILIPIDCFASTAGHRASTSRYCTWYFKHSLFTPEVIVGEILVVTLGLPVTRLQPTFVAHCVFFTCPGNFSKQGSISAKMASFQQPSAQQSGGGALLLEDEGPLVTRDPCKCGVCQLASMEVISRSVPLPGVATSLR
jgi:hypothetical protein